LKKKAQSRSKSKDFKKGQEEDVDEKARSCVQYTIQKRKESKAGKFLFGRTQALDGWQV
jgi:hypothetical protein